MTETKSLELAGVRPSSDQLKKGLPIFYEQLLAVLRKQASDPVSAPQKKKLAMVTAAANDDEPALTKASGRPNEQGFAAVAGAHGRELQLLGYTLSHVVHAYGAMCQSITELATRKNITITSDEFHDLNRCLDVAIAGAVTEYEALSDSKESKRETEHLGFLAHELRNALGTITMAIDLMRDGTVGFGGSTGQVLDRGLKRIDQLIERSLMEVRLRVDPKIRVESINLLQLVDQILVTASVEARTRKQVIELKIDSNLRFEADQQLMYSAISNIVQNALKYTHAGGKIIISARAAEPTLTIDVEDECGGLTDDATDLFKPFEQNNENRKGLGLGLTIVQRAIALNHGTVQVINKPEKGCIFRVCLPLSSNEKIKPD